MDQNITSPIIHNWHAVDTADAVTLLKSSPENGLSNEEAALRLETFGPNALPGQKRRTLVSVFLHQFKSPLIYLLMAAAIIAYFIHGPNDSIIILTVVFFNAIIGTFQEGRAERSMEALRQHSQLKVTVLRDGKPNLMEARNLVPGDILLLASGDAVGADARVVEEASLEISEAALTGESLPVPKSIHPLPAEALLADRSNMVYKGTHVTAGRGKALVIGTGLNTELGKIATLTQTAVEPETLLERRVAQFGRRLIVLAAFLMAAIITLGLVRNLSLSEIVMIGISQVVSLIPEGLPVAITVALAVGVQRMVKRGAIVRRLGAVETLGSTDTICSDKTGTLTRNEMTVTTVYLAGGREVIVTGSGFVPEGELIEGERRLAADQDPELMLLLKAAGLCIDADLARSPADGSWQTAGDPTEVALAVLAMKSGISLRTLRADYPRLSEIPFDSGTKMMATAHPIEGEPWVLVKGAPEAVLELCSRVGSPDRSSVTLDDQEHGKILEVADGMAHRALRLLAFAVIPRHELIPEEGFSSLQGKAYFIGLVGQIDPPRMEAKTAVEACLRAGIRPIMVTGDHKLTGMAIARELGIAREGDLALDGRELADISDEELEAMLDRVSVFARVHPAQKLRLVELLQKQKKVVAMTGDGVNDAPALARADVGVSMGITGTEVAKEASKVIITDDNFATIVHAVEEGRIVYRNLKKLILYLVTTSLTEIVVLMAALLAGYPPPLAAVQILWINLVTDGVITLPLIMEPREGNEMSHPPVPANEPLLTRSILNRMAVMVPAMTLSTFGFFAFRLFQGVPFVQVQTETFTVLAVCQWFNAFNCRSEFKSVFRKDIFSNTWLWGGILVGNALHVLVIFNPFMNSVFRTIPLPLHLVFAIGAVGSLVLWAEEIRKWVQRRKMAK